MNEREMLKRILTSKGQSLASYTAKLSQDPLITKDSVQLDAIVNEANKDEEILYAMIQDSRGKTLTSQYASINYRSPRVRNLLSGMPRNSELRDIIGAIQKNEAVCTISVPILAGTDVLGKISMGLSEYAINKEIAKTITSIVALNLAVMFALGALLFVAFRRMIFNPIAELAQATTRLAGGDLTAKVEARGGGEIRMLIDSFNQMAEDLGARTGELLDAQEELVRKEKLAILGQLSGSVGHELRNPLGVMSNAVYFLKMVLVDADETTKEYLGIIQHEIDNSIRIITDLLDFARTKPPQRQSVTAQELVRQSLERCGIPDDVVVTVDIPEALPRLNVDPPQMGQVLMNLITNGGQAMPNGGALHVAARLVVDTRKAEQLPLQDSAHFVAISVADTGEGITPANKKKLFQPLFTTKAKGIGLGLVVCKNLVEANGGHIGVESEMGKGTTFTVTLPEEIL
jgi:signal transduction histidine kinase